MRAALVLLAGCALVPAAAFAAGPSAAHGRVVRCSVQSRGSPAYAGQCRFTPDRGGSFSLEPVRGRFLGGTVTTVTVYLVGKGAAEVSGLTSEGVNSRWGEAKRSRADPACWQGEDFKLCAW